MILLVMIMIAYIQTITSQNLSLKKLHSVKKPIRIRNGD